MANKEEEEGVNPKLAWMTPEQREEKKRLQKEEQKRLREERKLAKPGQDIIQSCRPLWDVARRLDTPKDARAEAMKGLFELLGGKFKDLILKHEGSRVVQTCVKHGSPAERTQIALELKGAFFEVSKNKYGKHLVSKLLLYCPKQRDLIINEFYGHIVKGMKHKDASWVIETIFSDYSNASKRQRLIQEFYSPEFALFKKEAISLEQVLAQYPDKKAGIIQSLEESLNVLLKKGNLGLSVVHRLMLDYLMVAEVKTIQAWISSISDFLPEIVHTADGAKGVIRCVALANSKDRKAIIKSFKPFVEKICKDDKGFQTLLAIFALVDDTVLVGKALVGEVMTHLDSLIKDKHGRKVIGYLVTGKNPRILSTATIQLLDDARKFAESKKDDPIRHGELKAQTVGPLFDYLSVNISNLVTDVEMASFLAEVVGDLAEDRQTAIIRQAFEFLPVFETGPSAEFIKKAAEPTAMFVYEKIVEDLAKNLQTGEAAYMLMHMLRFEAIQAQVKGLQSKLKKMKKDNKGVETLLTKLSA
jgi:pumilio family protein 6